MRGTWAKPMAPVATGVPSSSVTSTEEVTERRPRRRIVLTAESLAGAGTGRIRMDMSVVRVHTSASPSTEIPASASTTKEMTLARTIPWCSSSGRGTRSSSS